MGGAPEKGLPYMGMLSVLPPIFRSQKLQCKVQREQEPAATENMVLDNVANILVDIMVRQHIFYTVNSKISEIYQDVLAQLCSQFFYKN